MKNKKNDELKKYYDELKKYYDRKVDLYLTSYTGEGRYPSNKFRLNIVLDLIGKTPGSKILDAGCGNGIFVLSTLERGHDCYGFDISEEMIKHAKELLKEKGYDPNRVFVGDIHNIPFPNKSFDKVAILGVLQYLPDHEKILKEIHRVIVKNGELIVSLDNSLFSIFSINKYTVDFLRNILSHYDIPVTLIENAIEKYSELIQADKAVSMKKPIKTFEELSLPPKAKLYEYNPLNVEERFRKSNFEVLDMRFYHYHPLPPRFEEQFFDLFNTLAYKMEGTEYDWRGAILCNQFVVRAKAI